MTWPHRDPNVPLGARWQAGTQRRGNPVRIAKERTARLHRARCSHFTPEGSGSCLNGGVGETFDAWYGRHHPRVLSSLSVMASDLDIARGAADEAFARAWDAWPRVEAMSSPTPWLYRTALVMLRRRERRSTLKRYLVPGARPATGAIPESWDDDVVSAVRSLPERDRTALALRYVADLPDDQIAEVMRLSPARIGPTFDGARRGLAAALGDPEAVAIVELEGTGDADAR